MNRMLNSIGHRLKPILFRYNKYKQTKCFVPGEINDGISRRRRLIYAHEQISSRFEYKDEFWNSIKYLGDIMWNDMFRLLPVFKKKFSIDLNNQCPNSKVSFQKDEIICKSRGVKNDWIFLKNNIIVDSSYTFEFEAKILNENSEFQFAFCYENIGNRYRFNLKNNRILSFEFVADGCFHNDILNKPLSLPIGEWVQFKITIKKNIYIYTVNNKDILCVKQTHGQVKSNTTFALILWDSNYSNINTSYRNLKLYSA